MTKYRFTKRLNDLLQVGTIIAILMSFAGYEAQQKRVSSNPQSTREYTKSSAPLDKMIPQGDTIRITKSTGYSTIFNPF